MDTKLLDLHFLNKKFEKKRTSQKDFFCPEHASFVKTRTTWIFLPFPKSQKV